MCYTIIQSFCICLAVFCNDTIDPASLLIWGGGRNRLSLSGSNADGQLVECHTFGIQEWLPLGQLIITKGYLLL